MRRHHQRNCKTKKSFESHKAAGTFLCHVRKRYPEAKQTHPYLCDNCGKWHIGHKPADPVLLRLADLERRDDIAREEGRLDEGWAAEMAACSAKY